jgi:alcohol-forming fatty acyl-CoA reductase
MLNIKEFYKDKTILISGCTGFLGKIILEKVIRTIQDYKVVYVMIRDKRGTSVE